MSITFKRVSAYLLDIFFIYLLLSLITNIRFINPSFEKYTESLEKYNEILNKYYNKEINLKEMQEQNKDNYYNISKYSISTSISIIVVVTLYFGLFQKYNNGQTLGKKITKLKVVYQNNKNSLWKYFLRILPMYYFAMGNIVLLVLNIIMVNVLNSSQYYNYSNIATNTVIFIGILDFLMMIIRKDKKCLHDLISGSIVELE